jgi:hypothetical protein
MGWNETELGPRILEEGKTDMVDMMAEVTCRECGTRLGGNSGKAPFKHLQHCLHVEADSLQGVRNYAEGRRDENGRRVIHILDALEGVEAPRTRREPEVEPEQGLTS